ncbi:MAG: TIGR00159 family protein, partial [Lactobacillus iners]|nr:TIGR00159 family protein [Lactobacillus iners]
RAQLVPETDDQPTNFQRMISKIWNWGSSIR